MSAEIRQISEGRRRYTLEEAKAILCRGRPDPASEFRAVICLAQAIAVLDLVTESLNGTLLNMADSTGPRLQLVVPSPRPQVRS